MPPLLLLGFLDNHHFVRITNALALIRLRRTIRAHFGCDLTDNLAIDPSDYTEYKVANPLDATKTVSIYNLNPAKATAQNSLDALRAATDTSYFKGNGSLWVKLVSPGDAGNGAPGGGTSIQVSR